MNWLDYTILAAVVLGVSGVLLWLRYRKKKGAGACCSCSGCPFGSACAGYSPKHQNKQ
ncbi:MAG: FeoB-associated Cys-rich membrane protein [Clostridiales bacterium]|nr:FeoB-associated Cys-rich membrane protein [Clostridiales bacterium]